MSIEAASSITLTDPAAYSAPAAPAAAKTPGDASGAAAPPARSSAASSAKASAPTDTVHLSDEALAVVRELQARDREVRQHEQAHLAAAGGLAVSGPVYTYQRGPDGVNYAVGGEVSIDVSPGRTPQETIERAQLVQAAALAPADPSGADRAVAMQAQQMEQQAQAELQRQRLEEQAPTAAADAQGGEAARADASRNAADPERLYDAVGRAEPASQRIDAYG
ncbi:MAG TPA: putative metalloprotease CJM1_0395 family protein [Paucimonas sp.]|nr:putative metalloprotease CJM1_0395 family protein [Paucimonas sp.]